MAGYFIHSMDAKVFEQLTTSPTREQALLLADAILDESDDLLRPYDEAAEPPLWPSNRDVLADRIRERLTREDWYADLTMGNAAIWDEILHLLMDEPGEQLGIDLHCENDGFLYWDAAEMAAEHGATMMAEPHFGNSGFRYSGKSQGELDLMYTIYSVPRTRELLAQLETVIPHFEALPDDEEGDRAQFFEGLLEPVRQIVAAGRMMWVATVT